MRADTPAITAAMNSVAIAETLRTISKAVSTGTSRSQGEILNVSLRSLEKCAAVTEAESPCNKLTIRKIIKVIANDGTVEQIAAMAKTKGTRLLRDNVAELVMQGTTSVDELVKTTFSI